MIAGCGSKARKTGLSSMNLTAAQRQTSSWLVGRICRL